MWGGASWSSGAAAFDGSTGNFFTSAPVLDTTKSFTVSAWAYLTDASLWRSVVNQDANAASGFTLQYDLGANAWSFIMFNADVNGTSAVWANSIAPPALNTWTHLVGVYDKFPNRMRLYVNGTLHADVTAATGFASNGAFVIGRSRHDSTNKNMFKGQIDNVQAYQRPASNDEISTLYNAGRGGGALFINPAVVRTTTPTLSAQVSDPEPSAQLWSEFEVRTAPSESATVVAISGGIGPVGSPTTHNWTVPAVTLTNGTTYYWRIHSIDEVAWWGSWTPFQAVRVDTSQPELSTPPVTSTQYPRQQWGALAGTQGSFSLSASSTDVAEFEWWVDNGAHTVTAATGSGPRTAAVTYTPGSPMKHILHVRARDLAGWEASHDYEFWVTSQPNVFAHWALDEAPGATTAADTGNAPQYDGELSPATRFFDVNFGPGRVKDAGGQTTNGLVFTGDGVVRPEGPVIDTTRAFTAMAWVNPSDLSVDRTILSGDGTNSSRWQLGYRANANGGNGGWCFSMRASDGATPVDACADGSNLGYPATGSWTHVAAVYNPALTGQQMRIYVMGDPQQCFNPIPETATAAMIGSWSAIGPFVIGRAKSSGTTSSYWRGSVDDVWAHQRALTGQEICIHAQPNDD